MNKSIVARWKPWSGKGLEHLVLRVGASGIVADSVVLGSSDGDDFAIRYRLRCDRAWRVRRAEISLVGGNRSIHLVGDGAGNWTDGSGKPLNKLKGAIDIDLSASPFTNTLPIRRLKLRPGQSAEILAAYIRVPQLTATTDPQRYTCLEVGKRYRYESLDSDFTRVVTVDRNALVTSYPGLFRRAP
jgi:uncharacterized protein